MPAPKTNRNAVTHGVNARGTFGFANGTLPKGCGHIERDLLTMRDQLIEAVKVRFGEPDIAQMGLIQSAVRCEQHCRLWQRWMRLRFDKLKVEQQLKISESIAKLSKDKDACIRALGLNKSAGEVHLHLGVNAIYGQEPAMAPPAPIEMIEAQTVNENPLGLPTIVNEPIEQPKLEGSE